MEDEHKTMITQLTDLDDHALDEQAGLFMHPRHKTLKAGQTPRPLSQPFFQPQQVFPDVMNVSAMVERQEQKEQKEHQQHQQQHQTENAPNDSPTTTALVGNRSSGAVSKMNPAGSSSAVAVALAATATASASASAAQDPVSTAAEPMNLALPAPKGVVGAGNADALNVSLAGSIGIGQARSGLRSVSLTRLAGEGSDGLLRTLGSGESLVRDGANNAWPERRGRTPNPPASSDTAGYLQPALRSGTPVETPIEEGDRQLSVETSRPNKAGRKPGKRAGDRSMQGKSSRLFTRRTAASSRGSEEDGSDENEQFIYRNSRSSLRVNSIPEEPYDEREPTGKRRSNRHRLSTYMSGDRRLSSGVGRMGAAMGAMSSISQYPAYGSSPAYAGAGASSGMTTSVGGIGPGSRSGRRAGGRHMVRGSSSNNGHRFSILTQSNNEYGESTEESDLDAEPAGLRSTYNTYARRNSRRFHSNVYYGSSEDLPETTPLFRRHTGQRRKKASMLTQLLRAMLMSLAILASLFVLAALFNYTSAPLADVEAIKVSNILATEKELLFILHVRSTNPNIREVLVERAEIGVFAGAAIANSTISPPAGLLATNETEPAILLGNVYELSDPMRFAPGSFRLPTTGIKTTQISIHHPGASIGSGDGDDDDSDSGRWRRLLKGPYDLTIRGTLQYTLWQKNYAARICIAKLANSPAENSTMNTFVTAAGLGCEERDDDTITLPRPPVLPFLKIFGRFLWAR